MTDDGRRSPDWDVRFGTANYAALVASYAGSAIASLAAVSILTRAMVPTRYGQVIAVLAAAQLAQQIGVTWSALSVGSIGGAEFIASGRIANVFWSRLALLAANLALLAATAPWWLPLCADILQLDRTYILPVLAYLATASLWAHMQQALVAAKLIAMQAALTLAERFLMLAAVIALVATKNVSIATIVAAYVAGALGASLLALLPLWRHITPAIAFRDGMMPRILGFSLPLLPGAIASFAASNHLSTFFLAHFIGAAAVAAFGVAYQILGAAVQLPLLAGTVLQPYFVTLHSLDRARTTGPVFAAFVQTFTLVMSTVCLTIAAAGGPLMRAAFGESYASAGALLWPLMGSAALAAPAFLAWLPLATATQKSYILAVNAASTAIFNLALHWLLTPRFGASGAAWAILTSYAITGVVTIACLRRERMPDCAAAMIAALPPGIGALVALRGNVFEALLAGVAALAVVATLQRAAMRDGLRVALQLTRNLHAR